MENDGLVQPELTLSNPSSTDIIITISSNDNTTTGICKTSIMIMPCTHIGGDYTSGPYIVIIPAGITIVSFDISITNDKIFEEDEQFFLTINESLLPSNVIAVNPIQATVTIGNDGKEVLMSFVIAIYIVNNVCMLDRLHQQYRAKSRNAFFVYLSTKFITPSHART